jgi:Fe-S cluster assembly ATP-binding protein
MKPVIFRYDRQHPFSRQWTFSMALLEVRSLRFEVKDKTILEDLDFTIEAGEIHTLLGSNGTGKSTLAYLIMGCSGYTANKGDIMFDHRTINELPLHERARLGITLAWQEPARFEGLLVWQFIALSKQSIPAAVYLQEVGLAPAEYLERALDKTLSGGERKRIELASVLAMEPRLAILDEPASGIDMLSIDEIADVIQGLKRSGSAVVLITHREEMAYIADRASYICGGKIICTGPPQQVAERYKSRGCIKCNGVICR